MGVFEPLYICLGYFETYSLDMGVFVTKTYVHGFSDICSFLIDATLLKISFNI